MDLTGYESHRAQMETGDLLAFQGFGPVSWGIQLRTKSRFSHVGMVVRLSDAGIERVFLLHSTAKTGVVLLPATRYLSQTKDPCWWVPLNKQKCAALNPHYQAEMLAYALLQLGRKYDFRGVLKFLAPFIPQSADRAFCSELAAEARRQANLTQDTFLSPGQLVAHSLNDAPVSLT